MTIKAAAAAVRCGGINYSRVGRAAHTARLLTENCSSANLGPDSKRERNFKQIRARRRGAVCISDLIFRDTTVSLGWIMAQTMLREDFNPSDIMKIFCV